MIYSSNRLIADRPAASFEVFIDDLDDLHFDCYCFHMLLDIEKCVLSLITRRRKNRRVCHEGRVRHPRAVAISDKVWLVKSINSADVWCKYIMNCGNVSSNRPVKIEALTEME